MSAQDPTGYDDENIFAKILRGEIPCHKVYEDEVALAFMDVMPQAEGHTLVIPKRARARNLLDMDDAELAALMPRVRKVARAVKAAFAADGIVLVQYNEAAAGQTVFHPARPRDPALRRVRVETARRQDGGWRHVEGACRQGGGGAVGITALSQYGDGGVAAPTPRRPQPTSPCNRHRHRTFFPPSSAGALP